MVAFPEVQLLRKPDGKAIKLMRGHTHQVYDLLIEALTDLLDDNRVPGATDAQIACMAHNAILEELRRRKSRMTIHEELEEMKRQVSAFRVSLLEMYKKHLESINHIPSFRVKEPVQKAEAPAYEEKSAPADPEPVREPVREVEPQPELEPQELQMTEMQR